MDLGLEIKSLEKVIGRLSAASIPYMLTGSMALNFYGHPRATNDFDIVVQVMEKDADRIIRLFEKDFYISPEAVKEALANKSIFNIIDNEVVFKIDLIVRKQGAYADEQFRRRTNRPLGPITATVISPEDLILAKLDWSRDSLSEMQERDVQGLVRLLAKSLDYEYLEKWASELGVLERLRGFYASV